MPRRGRLPKGPQRRQVLTHLTFGGVHLEAAVDITERHPAACLIQQSQDRLLPIRQILRDTLWRHVTAGAKAHRHASASIFDLRAGQPRQSGQLRHLDRTSTPHFDHAAPIEDAGDQRVPRQRLMRREQRFGGQAENATCRMT